MKYVFIVIVCWFVASCDKTKTELRKDKVLEVMGWLYDADPIEDALDSIKDHDYRFMAVYGVSLRIPQVSTECFLNWKEIEKHTKPIEGTSDAIDNYEHAKLDSIARNYAHWYNGQILFYLRDNGKWDCNL